MKFFWALAILVAVSGSFALAEADSPAPLFPFVLPWDDATPSIVNVSDWITSPAGKSGPIRVGRDGHLYAGRTRIRFFGINICFAASFPQHGDAEKVAARMAKFGINCVRFHHMDTSAAPNGLLQRDRRTLDLEQLDKLDYFIAQLKQHGIYTDLNLHVGRNYPDLPWEGMPHYFKGVDNFHPQAIEMQREYARDLLTHKNPYTKTTYAAEPAVAFIEINNENALFHEWWNGALDRMPASVADEFTRQWNDWLKRHYADRDALRTAWNADEQALGAEMLSNGRFTDGTTGWHIEQHNGARATAGIADGALRLEITNPGAQSWHVQLSQPGKPVTRKQTYTISFRAKADKPLRMSAGISQAHDPWQSLAHAAIQLTRDWQTFTVPISPDADDADARLIFSELGGEKGTVWFADASLRPGGILGLRDGETIGTIVAFRRSELATRSGAAQRDWVRFLWDAEERYWTGMARYLKQDLKAQGLVVGTQMGYSPAQIQAQLDVVDVHGYWEHPRFPGRPWDPGNWFIRNISMAAARDGGTLPRLIAGRVPGKPYICTEYNHPAPNTFNSEAFLMLAATAAREDWDGIFGFTYSHRRDDWDARKIGNFFDVDQHPTQMATFPAAVAMFCRGDVPAAPTPFQPLTNQEAQERLRKGGPWTLFDPVKWTQTNGVFTVTARRSKAVVGFVRGRTFDLGNGLLVTPGPTRQDWVAIAATAVEAQRSFITATGYAENTDMGWKNAEKSTVGRDWGRAPSLVEGISVCVTWPAKPVRVWALDERGQRKGEVPVTVEEQTSVFEIGPEHRTLWYEVAW